MPYANEIGQVILDKNPSLSVVVTKLGEIDHEFRFFKMNVIAGSPSNLVTTVVRFVFNQHVSQNRIADLHWTTRKFIGTLDWHMSISVW